jgi:hypothetical protein
MDPKREPESLAFVNAPMDAVGPLIRLLDGAAAPSRVPLEVGTVSRALDAHRDMSAAGNDAGGALLALVRSCQPDALEAVTSWFKTASTEAADEAAGLLFYDGFCVAADGGVVRMHSVAAYELRPAPEEKKGGLLARGLRAFGARPPRDAYGDLWGAEKATCNACRAPLLLVLRIATSAIPNVLPPECGDELVIFTCRNCVAVDFDPYYVRLGPTLESVFAEAPPDNFEPEVRHEPGALRPVKVVPAPAPTRIDYLSAKTSEITRVGGAPSWVQSARAVPCPVCDSVMRFIGQIADPPGEAWSNGDSGALYAFLCGPCRIVGTIVQHT